MFQILKSVFGAVTFLALTTVFMAQDSFACIGPGGENVPCPTGTGSGTTNGTSIFNRTASGWTSTGWSGMGTGGGGTIGGSTFGGGIFGGGWRVGQNFGGVSGPGGGIGVGRGWVGAGTGAGGGLGFGGYNEQINAAACTILGIPMGSFGALVMSFAGIIAIVAGAMGAYKMALSTIVVGAGSWILMPIVSLFFPVSCGF